MESANFEVYMGLIFCSSKFTGAAFSSPSGAVCLHIVRGDNIAIVGELDEEVDQRLDFSNIQAEPVMSIIK